MVFLVPRFLKSWGPKGPYRFKSDPRHSVPACPAVAPKERRGIQVRVSAFLRARGLVSVPFFTGLRHRPTMCPFYREAASPRCISLARWKSCVAALQSENFPIYLGI